MPPLPLVRSHGHNSQLNILPLNCGYDAARRRYLPCTDSANAHLSDGPRGSLTDAGPVATLSQITPRLIRMLKTVRGHGPALGP